MHEVLNLGTVGRRPGGLMNLDEVYHATESQCRF